MLSRLKRLIGHRHPVRLGWHHAKALVAAIRYGFPARHLTVIGVTGTDGKTTTVGMIAHILQKNDYKVGVASTAFVQVDREIRENATHLTSISPFTLQRLLREMVQKQCSHAVVEMSSHGLVQGRTNWTFPSVACITNIALEHLDYHQSMEQYIADKGKLFRMLRGRGTKVLNADDRTYEVYRTIPSSATITYSTAGNQADITASNIAATTNGSTATLQSGDELRLSIPGVFNVDNALCALSATQSCGVAVADACRALTDFAGMPGRMERVDEGQPFALYVDFAVSPQAYEKTLRTLRQIVGDQGRTMVLCSSCGNRMREKRPEIGKVCSSLADVVVVTEDETYGEDPAIALDEVWQGVDTGACEAHKIPNRRQAIQFLCEQAKDGDAVVLCGMGPFSTMNTLEGPVEWDERNVARDILRSL